MARAQGPDAIEGTCVYQTTEEHLVASLLTQSKSRSSMQHHEPLQSQFDGLSPYVEAGPKWRSRNLGGLLPRSRHAIRMGPKDSRCAFVVTNPLDDHSASRECSSPLELVTGSVTIQCRGGLGLGNGLASVNMRLILPVAVSNNSKIGRMSHSERRRLSRSGGVAAAYPNRSTTRISVRAAPLGKSLLTRSKNAAVPG
jgi:hypothetical protein